MKSYTDLEQSNKLSEIMSPESADMYYQYVLPKSDKIMHNPKLGNPIEALEWYNKGYTHFGKEPLSLKEYCIPCWSLTALLKVLPSGKILVNDKRTDTYKVICNNIDSDIFENPVDACIDMIYKLRKTEDKQ